MEGVAASCEIGITGILSVKSFKFPELVMI